MEASRLRMPLVGLPEGSDALLLGYPLLAEWGYHTYKDDDDVLWVE